MINLAVVGCGTWGPNLLRNFRSSSMCQVTRVCDLHPERLQYINSLYPDIPATTDYSSVLCDVDIDAIAIATPISTHFGLAKQALLAGKHVFVEKPMTTSVAECEELLTLARDRSLVLMVGHVFVFAPAVRKIRELIRSGELGEIIYLSSRRLNLGLLQNDVNVTWDLAPHDLSIILYLLDEMPQTVNCQGAAHLGGDVEDVTSMTLTFGTAGFAIIHSSWIDPVKVREMTIVGTRKMLVYDDTEPLEKIRVFDNYVQRCPQSDTFAYSYHSGELCIPSVTQDEPLKLECQCFVDRISGGMGCDSDGQDGLKVVRILEAASESLANGGVAIRLDHS